MLGIAKYLKDHNIIPELTLKFIAWGGHEWYFRGAKSYLKTHNIKKYGCQGQLKSSLHEEEDIVYIFSLGNFGFNNTHEMCFNVGDKCDLPLMRFMKNVAKEIGYTRGTGIGVSGEYSVYGQETYVFYHGSHYPERYCMHAIEFDRWPYPGYHRDGCNHTKGDVLSEINDTLFRADCRVIAEIILRLTVPRLEVEITKPIENSFYYRDRRLFTLPRKTVVYGPTDITVRVDSENGVSRVIFYIDGFPRKIDIFKPYIYRWREFRSFEHTIKVIAYDKMGNYADDELRVWVWRTHPILLFLFFIIN